MSDVDSFVEEVAVSMEEMIRQNNSLLQKIQILADSVEEYRKSEDSVKSAILSAQKTGDAILKEAQEKTQKLTEERERIANEIKTKAEDEAAKVLNDAKTKARELLDDATMRSSAILDESQKKVEKAQADLDKKMNQQLFTYNYIKDEVKHFKDEVIAKYKEHLDLLMNTPETNRYLEEHQKKAAQQETAPEQQPE